MSDFDPTQNRIQNVHLSVEEFAALKNAKHGWLLWSDDEWGEYYGKTISTDDDLIYRAKPAPAPTLSITVNGVTNVVAAGVTEKLEDGCNYWVADPSREEWASEVGWQDDDLDNCWHNRGLIHLTEAAARAHAMAMVGLKAEGV